MRRVLVHFILMGLLMAACSHISLETDQVADSVQFKGEVHRGESFEREIRPNLTFRLNYFEGSGGGWEIWLGSPAQPDHNFSLVVTPPYRGINARYIEGWHFRNLDNSGPNDGSVNAPGEVREFRFVLNEDGYEVADRALQCLLWACADLGFEQAMDLHEGVMKASGVLTITQMELGNLVVGERAWIEHFEFEVELHFPTDSGDSK